MCGDCRSERLPRRRSIWVGLKRSLIPCLTGWAVDEFEAFVDYISISFRSRANGHFVFFATSTFSIKIALRSHDIIPVISVWQTFLRSRKSWSRCLGGGWSLNFSFELFDSFFLFRLLVRHAPYSLSDTFYKYLSICPSVQLCISTAWSLEMLPLRSIDISSDRQRVSIPWDQQPLYNRLIESQCEKLCLVSPLLIVTQTGFSIWSGWIAACWRSR